MNNGQVGRDLILDQASFTFVQDGQKGQVRVEVGPKNKSLDKNDVPVIWDRKAKKFRKGASP